MDEGRLARTGQWLLLVCAALFVASVAFVIAAARTARAQPDAPRVELRPLASIKQIMNGIVVPASAVVYDAVVTTVTIDGIEEKAPANDEEWAFVAASAASLIESGNLMLMDGRAIDNDQWAAITREFMDAARRVVTAAEAKNRETYLEAGSMLNETCGKCHERYQRE